MNAFFVAILGLWHLYELTKLLPWQISPSIFVIFCTVIIMALYFKCRPLYKRISLGTFMEGVLLGMQLVVALLYFTIHPSFAYLGLFTIFIGMELIRIHVGEKDVRLERQQKGMEEERLQVNETFRVVRSQRHDFLKHVSALQFMIEQEQMAAAKEYMNELVDGFEETNLSIKGEKGVVAGILHQMFRKGKAKKIQMTYHLDIPLSSLPINDQDLVALVGNVLANAVEAAEAYQEEKRGTAQVTIQFYKRSGLYILTCSNHCRPIPNSILDTMYERYGQTTKRGEHEGMGTKIIADIVKRHQGHLDFNYKNEEFVLKLKIPAIVRR
ncbi:sensor histidine kinase [Peribacillus sp. NPDC097675]|uniref:sensor histidine kinase n=1 Tax=Peribacillus sp. NPDC097675 TaxID=3390618 RepID=UPI003CFF0A05